MAQKSARDDKIPQRLKRLRRDEPLEKAPKRLKANDETLEAISSSMSLGEGNTSAEAAAEKGRLASKSLHKYSQQMALYLHEGMSQLSMLVIRRLIAEAAVPAPRNKESLLKMLSETAKELLLNELELVVWSIYLDKFVWKDLGLPLETLLMYSAFAVKTYMNDEITVFQTHLNSRFSNFTSRYNEWITKHRSRMGIAPRELNTKFKKLTKPLISQDDVKVIDYNYYVDEILQISPPYSSAQDRGQTDQRPEVNKEQLELEPQFYNDDRVLLHPSLLKQESIEEYDNPDLSRQWSIGSFGMNPPLDRYESIMGNFFPGMSRQSSMNMHTMQLRRANSKEEVTALPNLAKQSSFVSSLINSDYP
jgi:hypothetical protein